MRQSSLAAYVPFWRLTGAIRCEAITAERVHLGLKVISTMKHCGNGGDMPSMNDKFRFHPLEGIQDDSLAATQVFGFHLTVAQCYIS